LIYNKI